MNTMRTVLIACLLGAAGAQAADREFSDVVSVISDEFHTRPLHIPLFGLVNAVTFFVHPAGAKHIDLAVFQDLRDHDRAGRDLPDMIRGAVGQCWKPFVHVHSYRKGHEETVFIYVRQQGRDWKFLVAAVERNQATVVQLLLDVNALARWLSEPDEAARHWSEGL